MILTIANHIAGRAQLIELALYKIIIHPFSILLLHIHHYLIYPIIEGNNNCFYRPLIVGSILVKMFHYFIAMFDSSSGNGNIRNTSTLVYNVFEKHWLTLIMFIVYLIVFYCWMNKKLSHFLHLSYWSNWLNILLLKFKGHFI